MGLRFESVKVHPWPHGQVVKTAASHAVNVGSNPAGVTKKALDKGVERWYNDECSQGDLKTDK